MFKRFLLPFGFLVFCNSSFSSSDEALKIIENTIKNNYYKKVDDFSFLKHPINESLKQFDDNAFFISKKELSEMKALSEGNLQGIGVELLQKKEGVFVQKVLDNSPAFRAGLKKRVLLLGVDKKTVSDAYQAAMLIRGKVGDMVCLKVKTPSGKIEQHKIKREKILLNKINYKLVNPSSFYVKINAFSEDTVNQLISALKKKPKNIKSLIIDLRDNRGGLLNSAIGVASIFLEKGKVVDIKGRKRKQVYLVEDANYKDLKTPIIILINKDTASAAEIVASALKDHDRAKLIGGATHGKGSVQEILTINGFGALKITTALYFRPNGNKIDRIGVKPDVFVGNKENILSQARKMFERK